MKIEFFCLICGNKFPVKQSRAMIAKLCSRKCHKIFMKFIIPNSKGIFMAKSYGAYHDKVRKIRGKPSKCEVCKTTEAKRFEWANLTGNYKDILDYKRMCTSCHNKFDGRITNITKNKK